MPWSKDNDWVLSKLPQNGAYIDDSAHVHTQNKGHRLLFLCNSTIMQHNKLFTRVGVKKSCTIRLGHYYILIIQQQQQRKSKKWSCKKQNFCPYLTR